MEREVAAEKTSELGRRLQQAAHMKNEMEAQMQNMLRLEKEKHAALEDRYASLRYDARKQRKMEAKLAKTQAKLHAFERRLRHDTIKLTAHAENIASYENVRHKLVSQGGKSSSTPSLEQIGLRSKTAQGLLFDGAYRGSLPKGKRYC